MLRSTLLATACLALALPASAENQTYNMNSFNELDVSAGVTVIYEAGDTQSIIAENDSGNFEKLVIENRGDALVISRKRSGLFGNRNRQNYTVRITGPAISAVEASSGSAQPFMLKAPVPLQACQPLRVRRLMPMSLFAQPLKPAPPQAQA